MSARGHVRGHPVTFNQDTGFWHYDDTGRVAGKGLDGNVSCPKCGKMPTPEGFDACLGYIEGASSACCGHGVEEPYVVMTRWGTFVQQADGSWRRAQGLEGALR